MYEEYDLEGWRGGGGGKVRDVYEEYELEGWRGGGGGKVRDVLCMRNMSWRDVCLMDVVYPHVVTS